MIAWWSEPNCILLVNVAKTCAKQQQRAKELGVTLPGQAEYLDMIRALSVLGGSETEQLDMFAGNTSVCAV